MKKSTLFKSVIALLLIPTMCLGIFVGCKDDAVKPADDTTTTDPNADKTPVYVGDFAKPQSSSEKVEDGNYVDVASIDSKYAKKSAGIIYVSALAPQMELGGIVHPEQNGNQYYRLDYSKTSSYSSANHSKAKQTAGVTLRFRTNANFFYLKTVMQECNTTYQHFADRGAYGFDIYIGTGTDRVYLQGQGNLTNSSKLNEKITLPGGYQEVTINFPLYGGVKSVEIGFEENSGAKIAPPTSRTYGNICFYGSSITQGCAASRPGNAYSNIICRMLNANNVNLGFSGSALGEQSVAEYIASRTDIAAFVMDYDYNNTVEGLRATHYEFYETVRKAHPDIPIIMVTRPIYTPEPTSSDRERQAIIKNSYNKAVKNGDENVYFVNGEDFFLNEMPDIYAVDMCHPNDLGNYCMAKTIYATLKEALEKSYPDAKI